MWLFAMFDLPVKTTEDKKRYRYFRKILLKEGFSMLQYSVYAQFCRSEEASFTLRRHIESRLPKYGQVRLLAVTDKQFGKMKTFYGKVRVETEKPPEQLLLF